jgi:hypothetical protein
MLKTKGEATKMKPGGSDESGMKHGSNPQRAAWEDGHSLNESYKVPGAHQAGRTSNASYMHPLVNDSKANAPKMAGKDPSVPEERNLKTKAPSGVSGKVVFSPQIGKNPA